MVHAVRYQHQVGGHCRLVKLEDSSKLYKPSNANEFFFYERLRALGSTSTEYTPLERLRKFVPKYHGTIEIDFAADDDMGEASDSIAISSSYHRHQDRQGDVVPFARQGSNTQRQGSSPPYRSRGTPDEAESSGGTASSRNNGRLRNEAPAPLSPKRRSVAYLVLQDLVHDFTKACILDIKMGKRQRKRGASPRKERRQVEKSLKTTSHSLGFRFCGFRYYDQKTQKMHYRDKYWGRQLQSSKIQSALKCFFWNGWKFQHELVQPLICKLKELRECVQELKHWRFWSSSLLIVYDGGEPNVENKMMSSDVKMIDFANTTSLRDNPSPDEEYLFGLDNLIGALRTLYCKFATDQQQCGNAVSAASKGKLFSRALTAKASACLFNETLAGASAAESETRANAGKSDLSSSSSSNSFLRRCLSEPSFLHIERSRHHHYNEHLPLGAPDDVDLGLTNMPGWTVKTRADVFTLRCQSLSAEPSSCGEDAVSCTSSRGDIAFMASTKERHFEEVHSLNLSEILLGCGHDDYENASITTSRSGRLHFAASSGYGVGGGVGAGTTSDEDRSRPAMMDHRIIGGMLANSSICSLSPHHLYSSPSIFFTPGGGAGGSTSTGSSSRGCWTLHHCCSSHFHHRHIAHRMSYNLRRQFCGCDSCFTKQLRHWRQGNFTIHPTLVKSSPEIPAFFSSENGDDNSGDHCGSGKDETKEQTMAEPRTEKEDSIDSPRAMTPMSSPASLDLALCRSHQRRERKARAAKRRSNSSVLNED